MKTQIKKTYKSTTNFWSPCSTQAFRALCRSLCCCSAWRTALFMGFLRDSRLLRIDIVVRSVEYHARMQLD